MNDHQLMSFKFSRWISVVFVAFILASSRMASAQVPGVIHYQGRVLAEGKAFEGAGQFKFALVNANGSQTYWQNTPDANADGEPDRPVSVPVTRGLYSVLLGDTSVANMAGLPSNLFNNSAVFLRVWFGDGGGFEHVVPDQRIVAVGYALIAATVSDRAITLEKLGGDVVDAINGSSARVDLLQGQLQGALAAIQTSNSRTDLLQTQLTGALGAIQTANARTDTQQIQMSGALTAIQNANARADSLQAQLTGAVDSIQSANIRGDSLQTQVTTALNAIQNANARVNSQQAQLAGALGSIQAADTRADALQTQVNALTTRLNGLSLSQIFVPPGLTAASTDPADASLLGQGFVAFNSLTPPPWMNGSSLDAPAARSAHTAVWTGDAWIIWGGDLGGGVLSGNGAIYRPSIDDWEPVASGGPAARTDHSAVWTGQHMLVWGGFGAGQYVNTGGKYGPETRAWATTSTTGAPAGRIGQVAVWTGSRLLVWGGLNAGGLLNDGALYDPVTGQWTVLNLPNAPEARRGAAFAWAGDRLILWGGTGVNGTLNTGAQLVFSGDTPSAWSALSLGGAPSARAEHSMVWTGQKIIVWGGKSDGVFKSDGSAYIPSANLWQPLSAEQTPAARAQHTAIWTGTEMMVLGGDSTSGALATSAAYNPATDRWRALSNGGSPLARSGATAAWSGSEALVFGGLAGGAPVGTLQRVNPQPAWTFYRKP